MATRTQARRDTLQALTEGGTVPFTAQAGRPERCAKSSSASRLLLEASAVRTKDG